MTRGGTYSESELLNEEVSTVVLFCLVSASSLNVKSNGGSVGALYRVGGHTDAVSQCLYLGQAAENGSREVGNDLRDLAVTADLGKPKGGGASSRTENLHSNELARPNGKFISLTLANITAVEFWLKCSFLNLRGDEPVVRGPFLLY